MFVGIDAANVLAVYQPVVLAYVSHWEPYASTTGWYAAITLRHLILCGM